jgi:hypothetical protein
MSYFRSSHFLNLHALNIQAAVKIVEVGAGIGIRIVTRLRLSQKEADYCR